MVHTSQYLLVIVIISFSHYFVNGGWLESDDHIFKRVEKIRHIPAAIVQGRYDMVCPPQTAWELHKVSSRHVNSVL